MAKPKLGLVGVGRMGSRMAQNLLKGGYEVTVYDIFPKGVQELVGQGAKSAGSPKEVAAQVDYVLSSLPGPIEVEAAYLGDNGVVAGAKSGATLIDLTSNDPSSAQKVAKAAAEKGLRFLDAPVSGGVTGAQNASLTIMCGGEQAVFDEALPVLQTLGKNITLCGPVGAGCVVKIVNQLFVGVLSAAVAEGMMLGSKWGVDPVTMYNVLNTGFASSTILTRHVTNYILKGDYEPGFTIDLLSKDVWLALTLGREQHVPLDVTAATSQILERAKAHGLGNKDMAATMILMEKLLGFEVRSKKEVESKGG
ncbi:MAG: NAD(P)-dependent oxidoreductase [Chloroflexota bacterium]